MAGQPASKFPKWSGNYVFGNNVLVNMPNYGSRVAAVIAGWSIVEGTLGRTFAMLIGARQPVAMSMYSAARSFDMQRDLLQAAVNEVMPKTHADLVAATLTVIARYAKQRHRFAHWIWGASADPALEALLLVEPKNFWNLTAVQTRYWQRHARTRLETGESYIVDHRMPQLSHEHIYVYRLKDLNDVVNEMERAFELADTLRDLAASKNPRRRWQLKKLQSVDDIQLALKKARKSPQPKA